MYCNICLSTTKTNTASIDRVVVLVNPQKTLSLKLQLIANNCLLPKLPHLSLFSTAPSATHRLFQLICANSIVSAARRRRQNKAQCTMQKSAQLSLIAHIAAGGEVEGGEGKGGGHKTTNGLKAH